MAAVRPSAGASDRGQKEEIVIWQRICNLCQALQGPEHLSCGHGLRQEDHQPQPQGHVRRKQSEYATQLNEKQKVKFVYGIMEKQFRMYYEKAAKAQGKTARTC